jgi:hypothetical protein
MLTTVFSITSDDEEKVVEQCQAIALNVKLMRKLDPTRHISLLLGSKLVNDLVHINVKDFDKVYEAELGDNEISFLAKALPRIEGDQVLYINERIFSLMPITRAFERNLNSGVFFPKRVLDFRGYDVDVVESYQTQQLFGRHQWPVITPKMLWINKDQTSLEFMDALDMFASNWDTIGKEHSDGAMSELTWDNLISFTCYTHANHYQVSELLNFRSFAKRDFAKDKNWVNKEWYDWLDTWWVTKDAFYLRVENFRQQGFVELTGDCLLDIDTWIEKSNNG